MSELLCSLPGWDLQSLGVISPEMSLAMDESSEQTFSWDLECSDVSTGYLEDALIEFSERSKRRRLLFCRDDLPKSHNCGLSENPSCLNQFSALQGISDEHKSSSVSRTRHEEDNMNVIKTAEVKAISASYESPKSSNPSQMNFSQDKYLIHLHHKSLTEPASCTSSGVAEKKRRVVSRVAYPFALVKPGGREDDVTINDINRRILRPPTRPVRHPVGDFACRPVVSVDRSGLSGKAVVALTRIQTRGSGTITVVRTKG